MCRARFDVLIKADRIAKTPAKSKDSTSEAAPDFSAGASAPPTDDAPAVLPERVGLQGLHLPGEHAVEGLVAKTEQCISQGYRDRVRQRRLQTLSGIDVLLEYTGTESSVPANAATELSVQNIVLDKNTVDLSIVTSGSRVHRASYARSSASSR